MKKLIKKLLPSGLLHLYHFSLVAIAAVYYRFPAKQITVIGVTGTKGKTSVTEIISAILEEAGKKTAVASTLRFKQGDDSKRNLLKMTMPGRFFLQQFLKEAVNNHCDYAIIEMTSEGVKMFRHKFIYLDALIFTGLTPEHIEAHGSYANYVAAKLQIAKALEHSPKEKKILVVNRESKEADRFLETEVEKKLTFGGADGKPYTADEYGLEFSFADEVIKSHLIGEFNLYNLLAAATLAQALGIGPKTIKQAIEKFSGIPGRMQLIESDKPALRAKQKFIVIVDYAHTPESLAQVYKTYHRRPKICVLGGTGGGRDKWKREVMGSIADIHCDDIILTDEDPYDEDPLAIVADIQRGIKNTPVTTIMNRRQAIAGALTVAVKIPDSVVLITGKGTDPYIMGPDGEKTPWSDAEVAGEELEKVLSKQQSEPPEIKTS
ncbi:MAG: UDP-N-acetylmuramyl-tripeptide synthetase [Candidatus Paceibacterota bacterium]